MNYKCELHGMQKVGAWLASQDQIKNKCPVCSLMSIAGVPRRYMGADLSHFGEPLQQRVFDFLKGPLNGNLLILGPVGTGKTHLAAAIVCARAVEDKKSLYTTSTKISDHALAEKSLSWFTQADFLIIDEIGRGYKTEAEERRMFELVNDRYNAMKPTVFIGNILKEKFKEAVGEALADRIGESVKVVTLKGESKRKAAKAA
jgi:DNA replication protein DnaC